MFVDDGGGCSRSKSGCGCNRCQCCSHCNYPSFLSLSQLVLICVSQENQIHFILMIMKWQSASVRTLPWAKRNARALIVSLGTIQKLVQFLFSSGWLRIPAPPSLNYDRNVYIVILEFIHPYDQCIRALLICIKVFLHQYSSLVMLISVKEIRESRIFRSPGGKAPCRGRLVNYLQLPSLLCPASSETAMIRSHSFLLVEIKRTRRNHPRSKVEAIHTEYV